MLKIKRLKQRVLPVIKACRAPKKKLFNYINNIQDIRREKKQIDIENFAHPVSFNPQKSKTAVLLYCTHLKEDFSIGNFFPEHNVYILKKTYHQKLIFSWLLKNESMDLFIWGESEHKNQLLRKNKKITRLEEGFIKWSILNNPLEQRVSLIKDSVGIYNNKKSDSGLEQFIKKHNYTSKEIEQSKQAIALIKNMCFINNHLELSTLDAEEFFKENTTNSEVHTNSSWCSAKRILVVGQDENNASSEKGITHKVAKIIKQAQKDNPKALIYYWCAQGLKSKVNIHKLSKLGIGILKSVPLIDLLPHIHHIYTLSSLAGFEALMFGIPITAFDNSFYSGRGLTDDRSLLVKMKSKKQLSIEELFFAAYIAYPEYLHPFGKEKISFFSLLSYYLIEKIKFMDLFKISDELIDSSIVDAKNTNFSSALRLLAYLRTTKYAACASTEEVLAIAQSGYSRSEFSQFTHLLTNSCNFDALVAYANFSLAQLNKQINNLRVYPEYLSGFFYDFATCLKNANGRVISKIPNYTSWILSNESFSQSRSSSLTQFELMSQKTAQELVSNYMRCLSYNIQYEELENLIDGIMNLNELSDHTLSKFCEILLQKPARSERNPVLRHELINRISAKYKVALMNKYSSTYDLFLNQALYSMIKDDEQAAVMAYKNHLKLFEKEHFEKNQLEAIIVKFSFKNENFKTWGSLAKRREHFHTLLKYFMKKGQYDLTEEMLNSFSSSKVDSSFNSLNLIYLLSKGDYMEYIIKYNELPPAEKNEQKKLIGYATSLRNIGEFERARDILYSYRRRLTTVARRVTIENEINKINFIIRSGEILNSYPQPKLPKGVIFIASQTCFNSMAMLVPCLREVKKMGYAVVNLMQGMVAHSNTGINFIDRFADSIPAIFYKNKLEQEWYINWEEKKVMVDDVNYYQGFYERLSTTHRSYFVNINYPAINHDFNIQLKRADVCLTICKQIFKEVVERGIPVAFVSGNSHVTPFSVIRDYCRSKDHKWMSFINANIAYENYFSNLGSKYATTMGITDMTLHKNIRAPFLARQDMFEAWYEKNKNNQEFVSRANQLITVNRNSSKDNSKEIQLINYLEEQKARGKKIICCFGKIPVDLCVPYDGGYAHEDMADWLNHTISICKEADNLILLVKPHPHELRPEIALDLIESFIDLIDTDINENIKLLGHRDINVHTLAPYLDLAILWNGSSSLELTIMGVPVLMCSYFGKHDYPVELIYPKSREQYRNYLRAGSFKVPNKDTRIKTAFLLTYMGTTEISIPNEYSLRQSTNDRIGVPRWQEDKIKSFLVNGDSHMHTAATRIIEKFEPIPIEKKHVQVTALQKILEPSLSVVMEDNGTLASQEDVLLVSKPKEIKQVSVMENSKVAVKETPQSLYSSGKTLFKEKKYKEAEQAFERVIQLAGENTYCRVIIGKTLEKTSSDAKVEAFLRNSIDLNPNTAKYISELGIFLGRKERNEEAMILYKKAIELEPNNIKFINNLANFYLKLNKIEEIVPYLQKAEKTFPDDPIIVSHFANALLRQRRYNEALNYYQRAIKLMPTKSALYLRLADVYSGLRMHKEAANTLGEFLKLEENSSVNKRMQHIHNQRANQFSEKEMQIRKHAIHTYQLSNTLSATQKRIVEEALDTGKAMIHVEDLFEDKEMIYYENAQKQAMEFRQSPKALKLIDTIKQCNDFDAHLELSKKFKPSVVNFMNTERVITSSDSIAQIFLQDKILNIANAYNGMLSKLRNVNLWINPAISGKNLGVRKGSQIWHRDQEDEKILKCFIYLTDVDQDSGALDYIPYSKCIPQRKYSDLHPYPFSSGYPGDFLLDNHVPLKDRITLNCKKGTIAFVDTNGFHRGGYVTKDERIVLMATYLRPTSPYVGSNTRLRVSEENSNYSSNALYALS